jgi:hypothetical protein
VGEDIAEGKTRIGAARIAEKAAARQIVKKIFIGK